MNKSIKKEMEDAVIGVGTSNMVSLPLYAVSEEDSSVAELLNKDPDCSETQFFFPREKFSGFFMYGGDIVYYVGGVDYSCSYTEETLMRCVELCK